MNRTIPLNKLKNHKRVYGNIFCSSRGNRNVCQQLAALEQELDDNRSLISLFGSIGDFSDCLISQTVTPVEAMVLGVGKSGLEGQIKSKFDWI